MIRTRSTRRLVNARLRGPGVGLWAAAIAGAAGVWIASPALGQSEPSGRPTAGVADPLEGRVIREVRFRRPVAGQRGQFEPLEAQTEQVARLQVRSAAGTPYDTRLAKEDIRRLNRLGRFGTVRVNVQEFDDASVLLVFTLSEQPIVEDVQSVGNRLISDQDIRDVTDLLVGNPIDADQIARVSRGIENLYRKKGYYLAKVTFDQAELSETGILYLRVREGERLRVTAIRFEGNAAFTPGELRSDLKTKVWGLLNKAQLDEDVLDDDIARLVNFYRDRGYLDVRADSQVTYAPNGKEAIVTFQVEEGRRYTLRSVKVYYPENARYFRTVEEARADLRPGEDYVVEGVGRVGVYPMGLLSAAQVAGLIGIKPGDVYSVNKLRTAERAIRDAYGQQGYTEARVERLELRDEAEPFVDLLLSIVEGPRYLTGRVIVRGNHITRHEVVRRQVGLKPDRPLDTVATDKSRRNLENLRLFEPDSTKITFQAPDPRSPQHRDVLVEVDETSTSTLSFGGAVSSDLGLSARVAFEQRNFDAADTPDSVGDFFSGRSFRGAGQTFNIELMPGDTFQTYSVSFIEPFLFETNNSLSASAYYRTAEYDVYDEVRYGGRMGLGRRFGDRWRGTLRLRNEWVDLDDIDSDKPADVFAVEGLNRISGVGLEAVRTSTDDPYIPTRGNRIEVGAEQVFGDFTFMKLNAEHAVYIPVLEDFLGRRTVLSFRTAARYIPQDKDETPIYERYYLGGQSFRGFDFRAISPVGDRLDGTPTDDPVGGTWSFFFGSEVRRPVFKDVIYVVGFIDTGTVVDEVGFEDYRVSVGAGLRVRIAQLSPVPLAFDFGFPVKKVSTDEERLFTFSIDIPFQ